MKIYYIIIPQNVIKIQEAIMSTENVQIMNNNFVYLVTKTI